MYLRHPNLIGMNTVRRTFKRTLLAALFSFSLPALADPVPALIEPPSQEHHVGKVVFVELVTPDLVAAKQFYGGLFGWTFRDIQTAKSDYAEAIFEGHTVAGLIHRNISSNEHRQPAWLSFLAVHDVDAVKNTAVQHGAKVLFEPRDIPNRGREAVFSDPQGAIFAVLASTSGDPADAMAEPGEWIWSSLAANDPAADAAFYQTLFNYEVFELPAGENKSQHLILATENYARASVNSLPQSDKGVTPHSHWLNFVRVEDTTAMAVKVVSLGGHVLVEPRADRHGGKLAVVSDPAGAAFGLIEWPDTESKEVGK